MLQKSSGNEVHCAFVMGKARVAPLKNITIPRMELTAAIMAARIDKMLRSELQLQLQESVFWSDSTTVLKYIRNRTSRFRAFVANRVETILKISEPHQWRYVNTSLNPADYASKGLKAEKFIQSYTWLQGPDFLTKPMEDWPENLDHPGALTMEDLEVKNTMVSATVAENQRDAVLEFMQFFSSWNHLKKTVAWMLKVKSTLLSLCHKRKELNITRSPPEVDKAMRNFKAGLLKADSRKLTVENLTEAEQEILRYCQGKKFSKEISASQRYEVIKRSSSLFQLNPVLHKGILRVGRRLSRAAMPEESKRPAILDKDLHVAKLILREIHENLGHSGCNHVLSKLQTKYWIPGANPAIRKILSKCHVCRRSHAATGRQQIADLP